VRSGRTGKVGETERATTARLLIADDHALVREGLRTLLSGEDGIEVIVKPKTATKP